MARRSYHTLRRLYFRRRSRPISDADGPGFVYLLAEGITAANFLLLKHGMTLDFPRRYFQHQTRCPNPFRSVVAWRFVPYRRRFGKSSFPYFN